MKTSALLFSCLLCGAVSVAKPPTARGEALVASSSLKMRLRGQILALVSPLRYGGSFPEGADVLALPMAQLGDWDAASRLATQQGTRDSLFRWRAEQLALRGDYAAAQVAAQKISDPGTRADGLLLIARLALDRGDWGASKAPLLAAMRELERAPDSPQLAYAAWLWGQRGDTAAARRVLWQKAYPRAQQESELAKKSQSQFSGFSSHNEPIVLSFASQLGLVSDIIEKTQPRNTPELSWILARARNRSEIERLRHWQEESKRPLSYEFLLLALSAARLGLTQEAQELRDQARGAAGHSPDDFHLKYLQLLLAVQLGEEAAVQRLQGELEGQQAQIKPAKRENVSLLVALWRLTNLNFLSAGDAVPRFDVDEKQLDFAAAVILAATPDDKPLSGLKTLALIEARRHNRERLAQIAAAVVRNIQSQARQYEAGQRKVEEGKAAWSSWSNEPVEIASILRGAQPGLEQPILDALVAQTPPVFRVSMVDQLYRAGFPDVARRIFDPREPLRREAAFQAELARATPQQIRKMHQIVTNWDDLAAVQARYDSPDAPARWFGAIRDQATRVSVLRAWIAAFYPQVELKPPYVRRVGGSSWYRVGGASGSAIGSG